MANLRIAVATDIHNGPDTKDKLGSKAPRLMKAFAKAANNFGVDCVIDIGDRISFKDQNTDTRYMKGLKALYNKIAAPLFSVLGNHDVKFLTREENAQIMGCPAESYSRDINGHHLIFWNPHHHCSEEGLSLEQRDMDWLRDDLAKNKDKPTLLFSHVPLDNIHGEEKHRVERYFFWNEGANVRKILEDAGNVILCMHGHRHKNQHRDINGIHYITQQSLVNQWRKHYRVPSGTFSLIEINDDTIKVQRHGKPKKTYDLDIKPLRP
ncbi:MAG: metallophosphoesterase [Rhodospirillales bacterium]|nr:metallophosphoesterase [Rhodospirillales bacterium]MCB9995304.1 metallophosphoesterase [Rhodospirillales bacterium]